MTTTKRRPTVKPATTEDDWPARQAITDPSAVRLLTDLRALQFLSPFLTGAHTLSSAAAALDRAPSTVAYWIPRFLRTGLVDIVRAEQRAGMPMPIYRAPARQLVVPLAALPFDRRVAMLDGGRMKVLRRFLDGLDEAIERDASMSLGFSSDAPRGYSVNMVESDVHREQRGYSEAWMTLRLTADDARALAAEMEALLARYDGRGGSRRYIVHAGVAPDAKVRWRSAVDDGLS